MSVLAAPESLRRRSFLCDSKADISKLDLLFEPPKLFDMMEPVHEMELPPLCNRKRSEERMIQNLFAAPEFSGTLGKSCIHVADSGLNLAGYLIGGQSPRARRFRRLASRRHITQSNDHECLYAVRKGCARAERFAGFEQAAASLHRAGISQVKMFQDFCGAPLPRLVPAQLLRVQTGDRIRHVFLQSLQLRVHGATLTFSVLSVRMMPQL